ncbi:hypothetical protein CJU90_4928 [Yarrowia sp. C11]|nr:hypothetical protein CJU90_4928 [Yarrowia sp. C11]KAG5364735.1 hypothetical protein CKK34_3558 [Yarrowia sp. E02]
MEDIDELLVGLYTNESYSQVNQNPPGPFDPIPLEHYESMMGLDNSMSHNSVDSLRPRAPEIDQTEFYPQHNQYQQQQPQILTYQHQQHYQPNAAANILNTNSYYICQQPLPSPQTPQTPCYNYSPMEETEMDCDDSLDYMESAVDSDYDPIYSSPSTVSSVTDTPPETPTTTTPRAAKERKKGETVFLRPPAFAEEHVGMFGMINFRKPGAWTRQKSK